MTKTYIDTNEMFTNSNNIQKRLENIKDIFEKTNKEMSLSKDKQIWIGNTSDTMYLKYEELSGNYEVVTASMNKIIKMINYIANAYVDWDKSMQELAETYDLDVNINQ